MNSKPSERTSPTVPRIPDQSIHFLNQLDDESQSHELKATDLAPNSPDTQHQRLPTERASHSIDELESTRATTTDDPNADDISPETGDSNSSSGQISKSAKVDMKAKLERSRQSARECRARKKLRYQYLEDLVNKKERAVLALRHEIDLVSFELV